MIGIDVVIPCYNCTEFLREAVESVLVQTIAGEFDIRPVIVDDGSDVPIDGFGGIARVIRKTHGGVSDARNLGAALGRAPFLAFLDADDFWMPHKLEESLAAIGDRELCACTSGAYYGKLTYVTEGRLPTPTSLLSENHILTSQVMTRAAFEAAGGFDATLDLAEDLDFTFRALGAGVEYVHVPAPLIFYRRHDGQVSARNRPKLRDASHIVRRNWRNRR